MTRPVDEKLVRMRLENQDFKTKAAETVGIFSKIREGLNKIPGVNLGKTTTDLNSIKTAASGVNIDPLANSIDNVSGKFSALDMITFSVLQNLTNRAVDAGIKIGKALTIDGAIAGFKEYEEKMGAVQTMLAGAKDENGMRVSIEHVNKKLEELNKYSDDTIYSFADMTTNISKFTNAGVDLDSSVQAIQGVANAAALSGANSNEASRAMYNFAQAIGTGSVKLIDWKSIENANMGTQEFKQQLLDAGVAAGTLNKTSKGMYEVLTTNNKGNKMPEVISSTKNWSESLQFQWMTTEVLTETLKDYADETTEIGKRAFKAAKEVKTFSMLMDTTKEAIQSGWAQTAEIVIGDLPTAIKRWTELSEIIGGMVSISSDGRNNFLKELKEAGVIEDMWTSLINVFKGIGAVVKVVSDSFKKIFPTNVESYKTISGFFVTLTNALTPSKTGIKVLSFIFETFFRILKVGTTIIGGVIAIIFGLGRALLNLIPDNIPKVIGLIIEQFGKFSGTIGKIGDPIKAINAFLDILAYRFDQLAKLMEPAVEFIGRQAIIAIQKLRDILSRIDLSPIAEGFKRFLNIVKPVAGFIALILKIGLDELWASIKRIDTSKITDAFAKLKDILSKIKLPNLSDIFKGLNIKPIDLTAIKELFSIKAPKIQNADQLISFFRELGTTIVSTFNLGPAIDKIKDFFSVFDNIKLPNFDGLVDKVKDFFSLFKNIILPKLDNPFENLPSPEILKASFINPFEKLAKVGTVLKDTWGGFIGLFTPIVDFLKEMVAKGREVFSQIGLFEVAAGGSLVTSFMVIKSILNFIKSPAKIVESLANIMGSVEGLVDNASNMFKGIGDAIETFQKQAKYTSLLKIAASLGILTAAIWVLSTMEWQEIAVGLTALGIALAGMMGAMAMMNKLDFGNFKSSGMVGTLIAMGAALLLVSSAVSKLSKLDSSGLTQGVIAVNILLAGLVAALAGIAMASDKLNSSGKDMTRIMTAMTILSGVVLLLTISVSKLAKLPIPNMLAASAAVAVLMGVMIAAFAVLTKIDSSAIVKVEAFVRFTSGLVKVAAAIAIFALSAKILAVALEDIGSIDTTVLVKGIAALGAVLIMFGIMEKISKGQGSLGGGLAFALMAASVRLLVPPLTELGKLPFEVLKQGLGSMAGLIVALGIAMGLAKGSLGGGVAIGIATVALLSLVPALKELGRTNPEVLAVGITAMGAALGVMVLAVMGVQKAQAGVLGIILLAGAIWVLIPPIQALGSMDLFSIGKALVALFGSLAILTAAGAVLGTMAGQMVKASAVIVVFSGALMALAVPLGILSLLPLSGILVALLAIGGALTILGVAGVLLGPLAPVILSLAGSFALFGGGMALVGTGISLLAAGLVTLAATAATSAAGLILAIQIILEGLNKLLPHAKELFINMVKAFIEIVEVGFIEGTNTIVRAAENIIVQIVDAIVRLVGTKGPELILAGVALISGLIDGGITLIPKIIQFAVVLIQSLLLAIGATIPAIIQTGVTILLAIINGIAMAMPALVNAGFTAIIMFIDGIRNVINERGGEIVNSVIGIIGAVANFVIQALVDALKALIGWFPGANAALDYFSKTAGETLKGNLDGEAIGNEVGQGYVGALAGHVDEASLRSQELAASTSTGLGSVDGTGIGDGIMGDLLGSFTSKTGLMADTGFGMSNVLGDGLGSFDFFGTGEGMMGGLSGGIGSMMPDLDTLTKDISGQAGDNLGSHDFFETGSTATKVFGDGIESETQYSRMKAAGMTDAVIQEMGIKVPDKQGKAAARSYADGMTSEKGYLIGSSHNISEETLNALGFFDATPEGRKKAKEYGKGLNDEQKYLKGISEGLSKETLAMLGLYPTAETGKKKTKDLADGISSEQKYAVAETLGVTEAVLATMGLFPPTEEGKKKTKALGDGISGADQYAIGKAQGLADDVLAAMGLFPPKDLGGKKTKDLATGMVIEEGKIKTAATRIATTARQNLYEDTTPVGKNYAKGTAKGMDDNRGIVSAAARRLANSAVRAMRSELQEASPSKVAIRSGRFFALGLVKGIDEESKSVVDATARMADKARRGLRNFVDEVADAFSQDDKVREIKFKPVVEMDKLEPLKTLPVNLLANANDSKNYLALSDLALRQNGSRDREIRAQVEPKPSITQTYEINITANGDLPTTTIRRMADQIQQEIKKSNDRTKFSRGEAVTY